MSGHSPAPWTLRPRTVAHPEAIFDSAGNVVHCETDFRFDYYPSGLATEDARFIVASVNVAHAFRNADKLDWEHLLKMIPDSGHGRFWKAVLTEAREALGKA